jgi:hypothetical protein
LQDLSSAGTRAVREGHKLTRARGKRFKNFGMGTISP